MDIVTTTPTTPVRTREIEHLLDVLGSESYTTALDTLGVVRLKDFALLKPRDIQRLQGLTTVERRQLEAFLEWYKLERPYSILKIQSRAEFVVYESSSKSSESDVEMAPPRKREEKASTNYKLLTDGRGGKGKRRNLLSFADGNQLLLRILFVVLGLILVVIVSAIRWK